jgi:rhodanese-related sulfurtransferase
MVPVPEGSDFPSFPTCESTCAEALEKRITDLLQRNPDSVQTGYEQIMSNREKYFIMAYQSEEIYRAGHIPGAVRYEPKVALRRDSLLNTLPLDKTIAVYCYTGHTSAAIAAYLNLLGYRAVNIEYGMHGFMRNQMLLQKRKGVEPTDFGNFPVISGL